MKEGTQRALPWIIVAAVVVVCCVIWWLEENQFFLNNYEMKMAVDGSHVYILETHTGHVWTVEGRVIKDCGTCK